MRRNFLRNLQHAIEKPRCAGQDSIDSGAVLSTWCFSLGTVTFESLHSVSVLSWHEPPKELLEAVKSVILTILCEQNSRQSSHIDGLASHCSLSKSFPVRVFNILFVRLQTSNYQNRGALRDSHLSDAFRFPRWRRPARILYHALTTAMMSVWSQDEKRVSFEYFESWEVASDSNSIQMISIIDACAALGLK